MGEDIVGHCFNIRTTQEHAAFRRYPVANILTVHFMTFCRIVGTARKIRHTRTGSAAGYSLNDLIARQLSLSQGQSVAAISTTSIAVPFMAPEAIGTLENGFAGIR